MRRKNVFVRLFSCLAAISLFSNGTCAVANDKKYSLNEVLSLYGFASEEQQSAFKLICEKAGIDLPENFGATEMLKLVEDTQKNLVNRADKQERWETTTLDWMAANQTTLKENFNTLDFVNEVLPMEKNFDAVGILGASMKAMHDRIKFVESLIERGYKFKKVVLLTGERYATTNVDCSAEKLEEVAQFFGIESKKVTETHLFKYLYENSSLNGKFDLVVIDTPQRDGRRPTTQTTVEDFCAWNTAHPEVESMVFISGQPHVLYQKAIIAEVLARKDSVLKFEVIGNATEAKTTKVYAGAMGSYIWANTPSCLRNFGLTVESDEDIAVAQRLYGKLPWIYAGVPLKR